jgi:hypothetical protein
VLYNRAACLVLLPHGFFFQWWTLLRRLASPRLLTWVGDEAASATWPGRPPIVPLRSAAQTVLYADGIIFLLTLSVPCSNPSFSPLWPCPVPCENLCQNVVFFSQGKMFCEGLGQVAARSHVSNTRLNRTESRAGLGWWSAAAVEQVIGLSSRCQFNGRLQYLNYTPSS